jgi:dephospho-CoA kinase
MITIGITGTLGAGKGTVVKYLIERYNFVHYSARAFLTTELEKRGLPINRDTMVMLANELRAEHHPGYMIEMLCKEAQKVGKNAVIESIRTPGEIETLHNTCTGRLFAVDADPRVRYERITERKSSTDHVSFEKFLADEAREMQSTDPNKQNLAACMQKADVIFTNSGTLAELYAQVDAAMI